jgi:hypothetical protein
VGGDHRHRQQDDQDQALQDRIHVPSLSASLPADRPAREYRARAPTAT